MKTTAYCIFFMIAGTLGVMAQNPAIHWTFDNVAGSNIADDSGNGKSGTVIGNINTVSGKLGNAVDFNNSGCVVQEQTTSMSSDFTVSVYFNPTVLDFQNRVITGKSNFGKNQSEWFVKTGTENKLEVGIWNGTAWVPLVSNDKVLPNTWQHAAFIMESNTAKLYHNGVLAASAVVNDRTLTAAPLSAGAMIHGESNIDFLFRGQLDDFRMYERALSATEIKDLVEPVLQSSSKTKIACVGNSITENWAVPETERYPTILQRLLGNEYEVRNYGLGGRTLLKKGDAPYWNEATYTSVKNWLPDIVVIKLGTNDSKVFNWQYKTEFVQDYIDFINSFKALSSNPDIYICKPIPVYDGNHNLRGDIIVEEIFPMLSQIAEATNATIIDLYTPMEGKEYLLYDRIHPNGKGTPVMAHTAGRAICPECNIPEATVEEPSSWFKRFPDAIEIQHADMVAVDIDNDGDLDVIASGFLSNTVALSSIYINDGTGNFTLQSAPDIITPGNYADIKANDINGDGQIDILFNGHKAKGIALGDGNGNFTLASGFDLMNASNHTAASGFADFNNDGLLDYYVFGRTTDGNAVFFQNADGTFTKDESSFAGLSFIDPDITLLDFNNDGYVDIFLNTWEYNTVNARFSRVFMNDGKGRFTISEQPNVISKGFGSATWGDVDGDGWLDLLLNGDGGANGEGSSDVYRLYRNNNGLLEAKAEFRDFRQISVGDGSRFVDWDNDGDLDIILTGWSNAGTKDRQATMLFECTDADNFTFVENILSDTELPGVSESSIEIADLNSDGKPDLLISGFNGNQYHQVGGFSKNICGYYINETANINHAPSTPDNLSVSMDGNKVIFAWGASTDDNTPQKALSYNLYLKNKTTGKILYNPMADLATGWRKVSGVMGNMYLNKSWTLTLPDGKYEWSVQAIDANFSGGSFAPLQECAVGNAASLSKISYGAKIYTSGNILKIELPEVNENASVEVFSILGSRIYSQSIKAAHSEMPFFQGLYLVKLTNGNEVTARSIIIN